MACKTETKIIGENEYSVTQWNAERAMLMKFKLVKIFGASLASLASMLNTDNDKELEDKDKDANQAEALSNGLEILFKSTSPEELTTLLRHSVIGVACNGKRITEATFEELYSGDNLLEAYKVFIFVIKVNYGNFIPHKLGEMLATKTKNLI